MKNEFVSPDKPEGSMRRKPSLNPAHMAFIWMLGHAASGAAADKVYHFDIPAENMAAALLAFSNATNIQLSYPASMVKGVEAKALSGSFTPDQALQKLLSNSKLSYRFTGDNTIALETVKTVPTSGDSSTLKTVKVSASAIGDDPTSYKVTNSSTATKTDTPIMETPFSIKAIPQQVLQDQQAVRVDKAVENISGVIRSGANTLQRDTYIIRGFDTGGAGNTYRNGVIFSQGLTQLSAPREMANLQQVEVLKGPASLLFGRAEPGGVINYITKQPLDTPYYSLQQQFGSYSFYRTTADATGPIAKDLSYRMNIAYENAESFRDFAGNEQVFVAPVLKWEISPQTRINFELEYQNWDRRPAVGIPPFGNRVAQVPIQTNFAGPNLKTNMIGDRVLGGFNWSHDFNDHWKLSHVFQVNAIDYNGVTIGVFNPNASGNASRSVALPVVHQDTYFTSLNLTGKFDTGILKHTSLFGFDYFILDDKTANTNSAQRNFNIFNPDYNVNFSTLPAGTPFKRNETNSWYGLYYQDQVELPFNLFALGGVRYDASEDTNHLNSVISNKDKVSPRGGLLWRPIPELSLYGSYTENFGATNGFDGAGRSLSPQTAQQWEIGTKTELWDGRFSATLAYYDLKKQNIAVSKDFFSYTTIGSAESRGLELDLTGELVKGWKLIGGYAYMPFAEITQDANLTIIGNRLPLAPVHSGSIWNTYEFQAADLQGLKFGAGAIAAGQRQGSQFNTYQLPGYVTANLMASYTRKLGKAKATLQLNVDNLLDKTYYTSNTANDISPLASRTFMGSVRVEF